MSAPAQTLQVPAPYSRHFSLLFSRKYSKAQVHVQRETRWRMPTALKSHIDRHWDETLRAPESSHLFNGKLCRLNGWHCERERLGLTLDATWYKELLYSNAFTTDLLKNYGPDVLSRALGISAVLISIDRQAVLIRRSAEVGEGAEALDVLGGHIDLSENEDKRLPDPFQAMLDELAEEANLQIEHIDQMHCIGLVETRTTRKPELLFEVLCSLTADEIIALGNAHRCHEIEDVLSLPCSRRAMMDYLHVHLNELSSSAIGTLWLYAHDYL